MIKEVIILAVAILAICHAVPVEDAKPVAMPVAVPVEKINDDLDSDDLAPEASAWGYGGWGRRHYGGGWGRGYGGGYGGGWGGGYRGGWGGYGGGWGRGYGGYWG